MNENLIVDERNAEQDEIHQWYAEASVLRLAPGVWPERLQTTLGNRQPFLLCREQLEGGEVVEVEYLQGNGCLRLRVSND